MTTTQDVSADTSLPAPGTYTVDPIHSTIGFVARHLVASKVRGLFTEFEGTIVIGDTPEASSVTATVKAASITTNQEQRDAHLKSPDFLDFENHPEPDARLEEDHREGRTGLRVGHGPHDPRHHQGSGVRSRVPGHESRSRTEHDCRWIRGHRDDRSSRLRRQLQRIPRERGDRRWKQGDAGARDRILQAEPGLPPGRRRRPGAIPVGTIE